MSPVDEHVDLPTPRQMREKTARRTGEPAPLPAPPEDMRTTVVTGPCERRQVIYVGGPVEEVELHAAMGIHVCVMVGTDTPATIQKLYGPAVFADVRIRAKVGPEKWEWVVEQDVSDHPRGLESHWQEVARFDCIHDDDKSECDDD